MRAFLLLLLSFCTNAFKILSPQPGEVINIDKYYNITWDTEGVGADWLVYILNIEFPDYALLTDTYIYFQDLAPNEYLNFSAIQGYAEFNLSQVWAPIYNEVPHGYWNLSFSVADIPKGIPYTTLSDSVNVTLTSELHKNDQRPLLPPLKSSYQLANVQTHSTTRSSVWQVVLSIVLPLLVVSVLAYLVRVQWRYHKYQSVAINNNVKLSEATSTNPLHEVETKQMNVLVENLEMKHGPRLPWPFLFAAFITLAPLIALLIALVTLLLQNKVNAISPLRSDFSVNQSVDSTAFYIDFDATRYTTVASWTSSIALLIPGFLTTLIWYRLAHQLEHDTTRAKHDQLLTPYQLSLLLELKSGTLGALWQYILYICSRRREKQARYLFDAGFIVLISTLLGLGIWFADTWLHVTTSTIPFYASVQSDTSYVEKYGRSLFYNCSSTYLAEIDQNYSCEMLVSGVENGNFLFNFRGYSSLISGTDQTSAIKLVTLGEDRIAYIAPAQDTTGFAYRANTYAVRSTCGSVDQWCGLPMVNGTKTEIGPDNAQCGRFVGLNYQASDSVRNATFSDDGIVNQVTSFFKDQNWQQPMTVDSPSSSFFTVTRLDSLLTPTMEGLNFYWELTSQDVQYSSYIGCHTEFLNFTYSFVNGSITAADMAPVDNVDLINAIYFPSLYPYDAFFTAGAARTMMADDPDSALENWIDTLHNHYLPFAAIVMDPVENIAQQYMPTILVARIPKAPLFTLGTLLILSIIFNTLVLITALWKTRLFATHGMQTIVSNAGLAASNFDTKVFGGKKSVNSVWDLFEESKEETPSVRIGITPNGAGGYRFLAYDPPQATETRESLSEEDSMTITAPMHEVEE